MLKGVFNSLPIPIGRVSWNTTAPDKNDKGPATPRDNKASDPLEKMRTDAILDRLREADHRRSLSFKRRTLHCTNAADPRLSSGRAVRVDRRHIDGQISARAFEGHKPGHFELGPDARISCRIGESEKRGLNRSVPSRTSAGPALRPSAEKYTFRSPPSLFDCPNGEETAMAVGGRKRTDNAILASIASMPKKKSRMGTSSFVETSPGAGPEAIRHIIREEMDRFQSKLKEGLDDQDRWTCVSCFSLVDQSIRTCPICKCVRNAARDLPKPSGARDLPKASAAADTTPSTPSLIADLHDKIPLFLKRPASVVDEAACKRPHVALPVSITTTPSLPVIPSKAVEATPSVFKLQTAQPAEQEKASSKEPILFPMKFSFNKPDSSVTSCATTSSLAPSTTPIMSIISPPSFSFSKPSDAATESTSAKVDKTSLFSPSLFPKAPSTSEANKSDQNSSAFVFPTPKLPDGAVSSSETASASKSVEMLDSTSDGPASSGLPFSFQGLTTSVFASPRSSSTVVVPTTSQAPTTFTFGKGSDNLFSLFGKSTKTTEAASVKPSTTEDTVVTTGKPIFSFGPSSVDKPKLPATIPKIFQFGQGSQPVKAITESTAPSPFVFGASPNATSSLASIVTTTKSDEIPSIFGGASTDDTVAKLPTAGGSLLFGNATASRAGSLFAFSGASNSNELGSVSNSVNGVSASPVVVFGQPTAGLFQSAVSADTGPSAPPVFGGGGGGGGAVPASEGFPGAPGGEVNNPFSVQASEIAGRKTKHPRKQLQGRK